jgi:hypothetical protein
MYSISDSARLYSLKNSVLKYSVLKNSVLKCSVLKNSVLRESDKRRHLWRTLSVGFHLFLVVLCSRPLAFSNKQHINNVKLLAYKLPPVFTNKAFSGYKRKTLPSIDFWCNALKTFLIFPILINIWSSLSDHWWLNAPSQKLLLGQKIYQ